MESVEYQYKIVRHQGDEKQFLAQVNELGRKGWRIISYSTEGMFSAALLELFKPTK
jgi:hypothetical protein